MKRLQTTKTKNGKRVKELRENHSRSKTGKVRTEGGGYSENRVRVKQFEVPGMPKTTLIIIDLVREPFEVLRPTSDGSKPDPTLKTSEENVVRSPYKSGETASQKRMSISFRLQRVRHVI
ncbi:hypothetical protein TNCV_901451 [Trichonephila clavipes]|nr:hypothetical protein TNCV_901451 [Trichonephila clavipes]